MNLKILESYDKQMTPQKSRHWFVRQCDWWSRRVGYAESGTPFSIVVTFMYVTCFFLASSFITEYMSWFWWGALSIIIPPAEIYRYYRCKYFKKHNLPGPYGWGTLDKHPDYTYTVPLTTVLGLS